MSDDTSLRGYHDLGGLPAGPVCQSGHEPVFWEKRVHALMLLLADPARNIMNVHELRRGIESLGAAEYDQFAYYERWIASIANNLLQKGVITADELGRKLAEIEEREARQP